MGLLARVGHWLRTAFYRRVDRLTAQASDIAEDRLHDLFFLYQRGFVRVNGTGQSITDIYADIENLIRKRLRVVVKPGTCFVSAGDHQNMVTTAESTLTLPPCGTARLGIRAACINAKRPIPGKRDRFHGVALVSEELARFLEAARNADQLVIQAGVWTLTDKYSRSEVMNRLVARDRLGNMTRPITHAHCDQAMLILDRLGIRHRLRAT